MKKKTATPSLFGEELDLFGEELKASTIQEKPRKSLNPFQVGKWKGERKTGREKRNNGLWEQLYPNPKR